MGRRIDRGLVLRRVFDLVLVVAVAYAALLAFGIVRRGGRFEEGQAAPAFRVASLDGRDVTLEDLRGRTALLVFFSSGCAACKRELPDMAELARQGGERLRVLLVSTDAPGQLRAYLEASGLSLAAAVDSGEAHRAYGVDTIPYQVVIDPEGRVRGDFLGGVRWSDIEPWLR